MSSRKRSPRETEPVNPVCRPLPSGLALRAAKGLTFPHHLQTATGHWIHMAVIEEVRVPDPLDMGQSQVVQQQHSVFICNPDLNDVADLAEVPLNQLAKRQADGFVPIRIHSKCRFGDAFNSLMCDCGPQLMVAARSIMRRGTGIVIYTEQEGRNAGLSVKAAAYRLMELNGMPTSQTFQALGLHRNDLRSYDIIVDILQILNIDKVELYSNNPSKFGLLSSAGIELKQHPVRIPTTLYDEAYLEDKKNSMGHALLPDLREVGEDPDIRVAYYLRNLLRYLEPHQLKKVALMIAEEKNIPELRELAESRS